MANNISRGGFRYHSSRSHGTGPIPERAYVASGYQGADVNAASVNLNVGDVVKKVSDGTVALAAGTDAFYAVIVNILPYYDGTVMRWNKFLPGNTVWGTNYERISTLEVIPVDGMIFEVDVNDATTATSRATYQTLIGENANHINTGLVSAVAAFPQLNIGGHNTTNTLGWRIVDISPTLENQDFSGTGVKLLVTANLTQQAPFTATGV